MGKPALDPVRRVVPPPPPRSAARRGAVPFPPARRIPVSGDGPEDVVVDAAGRLLCGVAGGRILHIDPQRGTEEVVGTTGGRPLGLEVLPDGRVLVCDADRGLVRLDPQSGAVETLVERVGGVPLRFCSNASWAPDGSIWFTQSTDRFDFEHYLGAFLEHRPSGRLLRRDPDGSVDVVLRDLYFPNGVSVTSDGGALLFVETAGYSLSRVPLTGPRAGEREVLVDDLPGFPDNLSRHRDGRVWIAMVNPRDRRLDRLGSTPPWLRRVLWRIPDRLLPSPARTTWVMAVDEGGVVELDLQADRDDYHGVTGVAEHDGSLYLASVFEDALLEVDLREQGAGAS